MKVKDKKLSAKKLRQRKPPKVSKFERLLHLTIRERLKQLRYHFPKLPQLLEMKDQVLRKQKRKYLKHFREEPVYRFLSKMPLALASIHDVSAIEIRDLIKIYVLFYESRVCSRGEVDTVKFLKESHGVALRFAANSKFDRMENCKLLDNGLPEFLRPFLPYLTGNLNMRRCALTILSLYKSVIVRGDPPSIDSISNPFEVPIEYNFSNQGEFIYKVKRLTPYTGNAHPGVEAKMFNRVLEEMFPQRLRGRRLRAIGRLSDLHVSSRGGPNGQAISTSLVDLQALKNCPDLLDSITRLAELTKNESLLGLLSTVDSDNCSIPVNENGKNPLHSRLQIKYEAGGKTRFFAIVDYFTQSVMKGFHKWIFNYISKLKSDGTKSQDSVCDIVRDWTLSAVDKGIEVFSTDLSKATDRLPSYLQYEIVNKIAGKDFARSWHYAMTQREFLLPNSSQRVSFNCGQPLGALSSWAMLALSHHVICRLSLKRIGKEYDNENPCYVVVGDDNALVGSDFEESYKYVIVALCRIGVSPLKGFNPSTVSNLNPLPYVRHSVAEFCKRVFYNGHEISTVSPETFKSSLEYPMDFNMLISDLRKRGVNLTFEALGTLACLNYNSDQATQVATFPLSSALPGNILEEAKNNCESLGIEWFNDEVLPHIKPLYYGRLLERVGLSVQKFLDQISKFRELFQEPRKVGSWCLDCPQFYNHLLHEISYSLIKVVYKCVDKLRTSSFDGSLVKRLSSGLSDLDELSKTMLGENLRRQDKPKRLSYYMSTLIKETHKIIRSNLPQSYQIYRYYNSERDLESLKALLAKQDVLFATVEDDWELVIPINFESNSAGSTPGLEDDLDF